MMRRRHWPVLVGLLQLAWFVGCTGGVSPLVGSSTVADSGSGRGPNASLGAVGVDSGASVCTSPVSADELAFRVVALTNQVRVQNGLAPLIVNETLATIAAEYACQHIEDNFYDLLGGPQGEGLSHYHPITGEGPGERAMRAGYEFTVLGENLAGGQRTPQEVVDDWMASLGHRENILAPQWREIGVSVRTGGHFGIYWVQMFGDPAQ